jgi:hypothetical protein
VSVVDRLLEAINAHDLELFVSCYAESATIEDGYDNVVARGHTGLRDRYGPRFESLPDLRVTAGERSVVGEFVVQEEHVTGRGEPSRHVAVYLVRGDRVERERLLA